MGDFNYLHITGVNDLPGYHASAAFTTKSSEVFKEAEEISPRHVSDKVSYMPWGADDQMPYDIINLIESDETLSTCQMFNAEVCYGSGLVYQTDEWCKRKVVNEVEEFFLDNDMASYFLGVCQDFKHFGFAVSVIILNEQGNKVVRVLRKEACYVRFAPANKEGVIPQVLLRELAQLGAGGTGGGHPIAQSAKSLDGLAGTGEEGQTQVCRGQSCADT